MPKSADGHEWQEGDIVYLPLEGEELYDEQICYEGEIVLAMKIKETGEVIYPINEMGFYNK